MFDLSDRPLVWIAIKWKVLRPGIGADDLAIETEAVIDVQVDVKDRDELNDIFPDYFGDGWPVVEGETKAEGRARIIDLEVKRFCSLVSAWRKVVNRGEHLDFNEENARLMFRLPGFSSTFEQAYLAACAGKADFRKGN